MTGKCLVVGSVVTSLSHEMSLSESIIIVLNNLLCKYLAPHFVWKFQLNSDGRYMTAENTKTFFGFICKFENCWSKWRLLSKLENRAHYIKHFIITLHTWRKEVPQVSKWLNITKMSVFTIYTDMTASCVHSSSANCLRNKAQS